MEGGTKITMNRKCRFSCNTQPCMHRYSATATFSRWAKYTFLQESQETNKRPCTKLSFLRRWTRTLKVIFLYDMSRMVSKSINVLVWIYKHWCSLKNVRLVKFHIILQRQLSRPDYADTVLCRSYHDSNVFWLRSTCALYSAEYIQSNALKEGYVTSNAFDMWNTYHGTHS